MRARTHRSPGRRFFTLTRPLAAVTCLLLVLSVPGARAQAPTPPQTQTTPAPGAQEKPPEPTTEGLGLDLTDEAKKPPPSTVNLPSDKVKDTPVLDEQSLVEEDRVKSIQRKVFVKTHRFELLPTIFVSINDPYYSKWGGSLRGSFFLSDTLAVAVHASIYDLLPTDDVRTAKANFQSRIFYSVPKWSVLGAVEWSPIYGKATIFNSIIHFDGFILGGLGALWSDTSSTPLDSKNPSGPTSRQVPTRAQSRTSWRSMPGCRSSSRSVAPGGSPNERPDAVPPRASRSGSGRASPGPRSGQRGRGHRRARSRHRSLEGSRAAGDRLHLPDGKALRDRAHGEHQLP